MLAALKIPGALVLATVVHLAALAAPAPILDLSPGGGNGVLGLEKPPHGALDGVIYFSGTGEGNSNFELWRTDGTAAGTWKVKELEPGIGGSYPDGFAPLRRYLYFVASQADYGRELWRTDGTSEGTVRISDIDPRAGYGGGIESMVPYQGRLWFIADDGVYGREIYSSDGTAAGTVRVTDLAPGVATLDPRRLVVVGDKLLLFTSGDATGATGGALWRLHAGGFVQVASNLGSGFDHGTLGARIVFSTMQPGGSDPRIWISDGTSAGTSVIENFAGRGFVALGGWLYFAGPYPDQPSGEPPRSALYRTNGTPGGAVRVALPAQVRTLGNMTVHSGHIYFTNLPWTDVTEPGLWRTDGTLEGTVPVVVFPHFDAVGGEIGPPNEIYSLEGLLFFHGYTTQLGRELWLLEPPDRVPEAFAFPSRAEVGAGMDVRSDAILLLGINTATPVSIASGSYSIGCGSVFTSAPGIIRPGDWICARHRTPDGTLASTTSTLTIGDVSATFTSTTAATAEAGQVSAYYDAILSRPPETGAIDYWLGQADRVEALGADLAEVWYAMGATFFGSPEYLSFGRDSTDFVRDLYAAFFNRVADDSGLEYWTSEIAAGLPREAVLTSFLFSPEFTSRTRERFGDSAARAEVNVVLDFYRGILGRLPDDAGFDYWVGRFRDAQCQSSAAIVAEVEAISAGFTTSAEYQQRARTNGQFVSDMYNAFMRRGAERAGVSFWEFQLSSGRRDREAVRRAFISTPEFTARVDAVMAQGCLP